jgi:hypothetical protein
MELEPQELVVNTFSDEDTFTNKMTTRKSKFF